MMYAKNSELIVWSDRFVCGIKLIDEQHRGLVTLVNKMFNHVSSDVIEEYDYNYKIIMEVINYVKIHFAAEEKIMLTANSPGYTEHKKAHARFVLAVIENINFYRTGKKFNLYAFTKFLKDWVLSHIAIMDKQCFEGINDYPV